MPSLIGAALFALSVVSIASAATEVAPPAVQTAEVAPPPVESVRRWHFSFGTGLEVRGQQEINPQYMEAKVLPQFFVQVRYFPYTLSLEGSYERRDTSTGPLSVSSQSSQMGLWGRYEFIPAAKLSPYAGAGVGLSFDTVDLNYGDAATKTYRGRREFFGLSAGVRYEFWNHLMQELETKAVLIEDRRDIALSLIYRLGFVY